MDSSKYPDDELNGWENTSVSDSGTIEESSRDEVKAVREQSKAETFQVLKWKLAATLALLATALIVTFTTYKLMVEQEDKIFRNVVSFPTSHGSNKLACIV